MHRGTKKAILSATIHTPFPWMKLSTEVDFLLMPGQVRCLLSMKDMIKINLEISIKE